MLRINTALERYDDGTDEGLELHKFGCIVRTDARGRFSFTFGFRDNVPQAQSVLGVDFTVQIGDG